MGKGGHEGESGGNGEAFHGGWWMICSGLEDSIIQNSSDGMMECKDNSLRLFIY